MNRSPVVRFGALILLATTVFVGLACDPVPKGEPESATGTTVSAESDPRLPGVESVDEALRPSTHPLETAA